MNDFFTLLSPTMVASARKTQFYRKLMLNVEYSIDLVFSDVQYRLVKPFETNCD